MLPIHLCISFSTFFFWVSSVFHFYPESMPHENLVKKLDRSYQMAVLTKKFNPYMEFYGSEIKHEIIISHVVG